MEVLTNLKAIQRRYRVYKEEYCPGREDSYRILELRGIRGIIYPYSEIQFICLLKPGPVGANIERSKNWKVHRDSTDGREFLFEPKDLKFFAELIGCRKKRRLSEKHKKSLLEAGEKHRYRALAAE